MALFKRQKSQTIAELENYYSQHDSSNGRAWAMALLSLLITISALTLLFLGGRWVYRTITKDDTTVTVATKDTADTSNQASENTSDEHQHASDASVESEGVVSQEAASTTTPSTTQTEHESHTGTTTTPSTGAGDIIFVVPAIAFVAGYAISRKKQLS